MSIFENLLLTGNEERFIKIWNKKLKKQIVYDSSFNHAVNSEEFFMEYLRKIKWKKSVSFDENTIIIENVTLAKAYKEYFFALWKQIPRRYLFIDPNPESFESGNSCFDGIDNNFDKEIDLNDIHCQRNR